MHSFLGEKTDGIPGCRGTARWLERGTRPEGVGPSCLSRRSSNGGGSDASANSRHSVSELTLSRGSDSINGPQMSIR
jgi:hypothetical protein